MPLRHHDPFAPLTLPLNAHVNPYATRLVQAGVTGDLPVLFGESLRGVAGYWRQRIALLHHADKSFTTADQQIIEATQFRRLIVEIGCHKGQTLLEMAAENPQDAFIGIDITFKRVVYTAERAKAAGLKNIACVLANAMSLDLLFAAGEIDGSIIFFPDPWVRKKRQAKHRLVDVGFSRRLYPLLATNGFCWFKTDQYAYFEEARLHFDAAGLHQLQTSEFSLGRDYSSAFEQRFRAQNLPTYGAHWCKISEKPLENQ